MNKYTTGFLISWILVSSAYAGGSPYQSPYSPSSNSHSSSQSSSHSSSGANAGSASGASSSNSLGGEYGSNNPTNTITQAPAAYGNSSDGRIFTGGGNGTPNFLVVVPSVQHVAPGVDIVDGHEHVVCDQREIGGLPLCFSHAEAVPDDGTRPDKIIGDHGVIQGKSSDADDLQHFREINTK